MKSSVALKNALSQYKENELIFASSLYKAKFCNLFSEEAFYKTVERMCKSGEIVKIAKGTYHLPKVSKYGIVPPSEKDIVSAFTNNCKGTVVGYSLYNNLNLTTQVAKSIDVMSSNLESFTKTIRNVTIQQVLIDFTDEVKNAIHSFEVLQNYYNIQEMNNHAFLEYTKKIATCYNEEIFNKVLTTVNYKKSTIAFMREVLNFYGVENNLNRYLSKLSEYKYPKMEDIYETTRV